VYQTVVGRILEDAILLTNVSNVKIAKNSFSDFTKYGIYIAARAGTTTGIDLVEVEDNYFENSDGTLDVIYFNPLAGGGTVKVRENYFATAPASGKYKLLSYAATQIHFVDNIGAEQGLSDYLQATGTAEVIYKNVVPLLAASPTSGLFVVTDEVRNSAPAGAATPGWVCIFRFDTTLNGGEPSGETDMLVTASTGALDGDIIGVMQDDGSVKWTTIASGQGTTTLVLTAGLTDDAATGNAVYILRWKAKANLAA